MTSKTKRAGAPPAETTFCVLIEAVDGLGTRGEVRQLDLDRASALETEGRARRATARDLAIAGIPRNSNTGA